MKPSPEKLKLYERLNQAERQAVRTHQPFTPRSWRIWWIAWRIANGAATTIICPRCGPFWTDWQRRAVCWHPQRNCRITHASAAGFTRVERAW